MGARKHCARSCGDDSGEWRGHASGSRRLRAALLLTGLTASSSATAASVSGGAAAAPAPADTDKEGGVAGGARSRAASMGKAMAGKAGL